jgi:hypothetical protein
MALILRKDLWERLQCLIYHKDIPPRTVESMGQIRQEYVDLAETLVGELPEGRSKRLALMHLEDSLMRAIQALALQGTPDVEE